jgi:hypothetical protein
MEDSLRLVRRNSPSRIVHFDWAFIATQLSIPTISGKWAKLSLLMLQKAAYVDTYKMLYANFSHGLYSAWKGSLEAPPHHIEPMFTVGQLVTQYWAEWFLTTKNPEQQVGLRQEPRWHVAVVEAYIGIGAIVYAGATYAGHLYTTGVLGIALETVPEIYIRCCPSNITQRAQKEALLKAWNRNKKRKGVEGTSHSDAPAHSALEQFFATRPLARSFGESFVDWKAVKLNITPVPDGIGPCEIESNPSWMTDMADMLIVSTRDSIEHPEPATGSALQFNGQINEAKVAEARLMLCGCDVPVSSANQRSLTNRPCTSTPEFAVLEPVLQWWAPWFLVWNQSGPGNIWQTVMNSTGKKPEWCVSYITSYIGVRAFVYAGTHFIGHAYTACDPQGTYEVVPEIYLQHCPPNILEHPQFKGIRVQSLSASKKQKIALVQ